ncbi:MAG: hypothetical protein JW709_02935 [Sedimentisphaerales bacterium]|nr:hypothetical protein [Sedimentisphaerales bacterium]
MESWNNFSNPAGNWQGDEQHMDTFVLYSGDDASVSREFKRFRPSGKINPFRYIPALAVGIVMAGLMAFVLLLAEDRFYYVFITPFCLGLLVLLNNYIVIRLGHCRMPVLAVIVGMVLIAIYYIGYWQLSFRAYKSYASQAGGQHAAEAENVNNVWEYFNYRCSVVTFSDSSTPLPKDDEPDAADRVFAYVFYGSEFLVLLGLGIVSSWNLSRRVFYEGPRRWSSKKDLYFSPGELSTLLNILLQDDWGRLASLARLPKLKQGEMTSKITWQLEYLKNHIDAPAYLTLKGSNIGKNSKLERMGITKAGFFGKTILRQVEIPASSFGKIIQSLPELKISASAPSTISEPASCLSSAVINITDGGLNGAVTEIELPSDATPVSTKSPQVVYSPGLKGRLEKFGLLPPRIEGPDFRQAAVQASVQHLNQTRPETLDAAGSLCLAIPEDYRLDAKKCAHFEFVLIGIFMLVLVALVPIFFIGASLLDSKVPINKMLGTVVMCIAMFLFVLNIVFLCCASKIKERHFCKRFLSRPGALFHREAGKKIMMFFLEDLTTYHINKKSPDDVCLCLLDNANQRLLIEGCNHRYIINGRDVTRLSGLESGSKVSFELIYHIAQISLALVFYRESSGRYVLNPLLTMRNGKRLVRKLQNTLGLPQTS